jgi:hypothetical protein
VGMSFVVDQVSSNCAPESTWYVSNFSRFSYPGNIAVRARHRGLGSNTKSQPSGGICGDHECDNFTFDFPSEGESVFIYCEPVYGGNISARVFSGSGGGDISREEVGLTYPGNLVLVVGGCGGSIGGAESIDNVKSSIGNDLIFSVCSIEGSRK